MSVAMNLQSVEQAVAGRLVGEDVNIRGVSTDSRQVAPGELFIALRGENFNGHDFLASAAERGAAAAMIDVDALADIKDCGLPLVVVSDTRLALGALAADWRRRFELPLIAVTGSNGKTTSKEMIASILKAAFGDAVLASAGVADAFVAKLDPDAGVVWGKRFGDASGQNHHRRSRRRSRRGRRRAQRARAGHDAARVSRHS